jgi:hypothetical protein
MNKEKNFFGTLFDKKEIKKDLIIYYFVLLVIFWFINTILMFNGHFTFNTTPLTPNLNNTYDTTPRIGKDSYILLDSLYYTTVTQTTAGYGDIAPATPIAKILSTIHLLLAYSIVGFIIL